MLFEWVKSAYTKNKTVFYMTVVVAMCEVTNSLETLILENITLVSRESPAYLEHDPGNYSCPYVPTDERHSGQSSSFYWTERQKATVEIIRTYSPVFSFLFGGLYSDKYGGHRVVSVGLIVYAIIMSTGYLYKLNNNYIFMTMLAVRRVGQGITWAAIFSLAGKLAMSDQRTIFVSVLLAGEGIGVYLAYIVSRIIRKWRNISMFLGFVNFVTAIWWWMICRHAQFPTVCRISHIPWKSMMTSVSLYAIVLLNSSSYLFNLISVKGYEIYAKRVIFFKFNPEWVVIFVFRLTDMFSYIFCGASSDYIISKRYVSFSIVRRTFVGLSVVTLICTLVVVKVAQCDRFVVLGCFIILHYAAAIAWSTSMAAILDFSPLCSGIITGISFMSAIVLSSPLYSVLSDIFVSGDSKAEIISWSELFFATAFIGSLFSLPFVCSGIKETSWSTEPSLRSRRKHLDTDSVVLSKSAQPGKQEFIQGTNPGPSNR